MCPHGYHHSGSMATPTLGTRDVRFIYIYIYKYIIRIYNKNTIRIYSPKGVQLPMVKGHPST